MLSASIYPMTACAFRKRKGRKKKTKNKKTTAGTGKRWEITSYHYVAVNALSWGPRITVGSVLSVLLGTSTNQGKSATKREGRSLARLSILRCESHNIVVDLFSPDAGGDVV